MGITTRHVGKESRDWRSPGPGLSFTLTLRAAGGTATQSDAVWTPPPLGATGNEGDDDDYEDDYDDDYDNDKEERRDAFVDYLEMMIQDTDASDGTTVEKAMARKKLWACIQALRDPTLQLPGWDDTETDNALDNARLLQKLDKLVRGIECVWVGGVLPHSTNTQVGGQRNDQHADDKDDEDDKDDNPPKAGPVADADAQLTVPTWHGDCCALTGETDPPTAVHLVPLFVAQSQSKRSFVATMLEDLWGEDAQGTMAGVLEDAAANILPLGPTAHHLWQRYKFALRPIQDPADPRHGIYLQVVWLVLDGRVDHLPQVLADGNVVHLCTSDPERYPLPSLRLLQMQYRARQLVAGIRMPGVLREIFRGNPDDNVVEELDGDDDNDDDDVDMTEETDEVPLEWQSLLQAAVEASVFNDALADRWSRAIVRKQQQELRQMKRISRRIAP